MVRLPTNRADREHDIDSTMTPMIDVVFLLLIFFVWTAGTQIVEYILPTQMSAQMGSEQSDLSDPPPEQDFDKVVVRVRWDGALVDFTVNDQAMDTIDTVTASLQGMVEVSNEVPIVVHPDQNVPLGYVIEVYDRARAVGFDKVSFAVNSVKP